MTVVRVEGAFTKLRDHFGQPKLPPQELIANPDQVKRMTLADSLQMFVDGNHHQSQPAHTAPPLLRAEQVEDAHLWAVRREDVVHAAERCAFGAKLTSHVIKHTNLTGGDAAYSGGEMLFLGDDTIVVNGCSGRYGPRSKEELLVVVTAFAESGYKVMYMDYDEETNRPLPFLGVRPKWFN